MITPDFSFETSQLPPNTRFLLGIDEVGRGPWAGPVTIGAFLLDLKSFDPQTFINLKVRDSKTLSEPQRLKQYQYFQQNNYSFKTFSASSQIIDQQGIATAIENLISQALTHFSSQFDFCLLDGNLDIKKITPPLSSKRGQGEILSSLIDADATCFSVAAASIVAKVDRDLFMDQLDKIYPHYDFKNNKGYGTPKHQQGLKSHGHCPVHRYSYSPIKNLVANP